MQPRPADETLSPLGQSLGESLAVTRHMLLVAAPLGALVGVAIAGYDWVVNELLWLHVAERSLAVQMVAPTGLRCSPRRRCCSQSAQLGPATTIADSRRIR